MEMREEERRVLRDRRRHPTPALSRFTLWGRRRTLRREEDRKRGGYVDRYEPDLLFLLTLIVGLNVLDALLTTMILDNGGHELNPIVRSVIEIYRDGFWIWKFGVVTVPLILLCLHSNFRFTKAMIFGIAILYLGVILYQLLLVIHG